MNDTRDALRKAAILINSLDSRGADMLLDQMGPEQAARVRIAVMELDEISPAEQQVVMTQFLQRDSDDSGVQLDISTAGRQAQPEAAAMAAPSMEANQPSHSESGDRDSTSSPPSSPPSEPTTPFQFLHDASTTALIRVLQQEHPQTVAVVLAHVRPQLAADVLAELTADMQCDVLRRVAVLDTTDPAIVADLERQMERLLSDHIRSRQRRAAGRAAVHAILDAAVPHSRSRLAESWQSAERGLDDRQTNRMTSESTFADAPDPPSPPPPVQIPVDSASKVDVSRSGMDSTRLTIAPSENEPRSRSSEVPIGSPRGAGPETESVAAVPGTSHRSSAPLSDPSPTESPTESPTRAPAEPDIEIAFDDLLGMANRSLQLLCDAVDPDVLCLALVGAPPELMARLLQPLSRRDARCLRQRIEHQGPLRLDDIERAQQHVGQIAAGLVRDGQITAPAPCRFAAAA